MTDLRDLYQEVILDHNKSPRNYREMADASRIALGHNPLCGDKMKLYVRIEGDRIADVAFQGSGCAISKASASIMTDTVKGKTLAEAGTLYGQFHELLTGPPDVKTDGAGLGKLAVFSGVREFPARVKCATLAWHTLQTALKNQQEVAKTE
ncbi:MAG TPA: SUF system NifU family Fe-S cluster assembly protein [Thermoanaerobaculia bacterium]|jgi:nitrogen fixation NifU-like protein